MKILCSSSIPLTSEENQVIRCRFKSGQEVTGYLVKSSGQVYCESAGDDYDIHDNPTSFTVRTTEQQHDSEVATECNMETMQLEPESDEGLLKARQLSWMDRLLSVWVLASMVFGVVFGLYVPGTKDNLSQLEIATVSLPVAIGLWLMMYPVLVKVQYEHLGSVFQMRRTWEQLSFSLICNWMIGPFVMLALAWATLPDLPHYRNGVILIGLARCIAMVLIWNDLADGNAELCAILVAINSALQILLYAPLSIFFLQIISRQYLDPNSTFQLSWWTVCRSVLVFLGIPLVAAIVTRYSVRACVGKEWFDNRFVKVVSPIALIALLWTVFCIFAIQGHNIVDNIGSVCRVAVPMLCYFTIMWLGVLAASMLLKFSYEDAITQAFTASSNNFELAIAVAAATFGVDSNEALAATVGPLVEVPVLLSLVYVARVCRKYFEK